MEHSAIVAEGLDRLHLDQTQPVIYNRPIGIRLLYRDPSSGAEHYVVRYPEGLAARWHRHTAAHTIVVLDGVLTSTGGTSGRGRTAISRPVRPCTTRSPTAIRACSSPSSTDRSTCTRSTTSREGPVGGACSSAARARFLSVHSTADRDGKEPQNGGAAACER